MARPDRPFEPFEPLEPFEPFDPFRVRRSCLAVPASSERFIAKAHGLPAARARGLQAIDGPYLKVRDVDGFRRSAGSAAALGYDGKWVLHPDQIDTANEVFAPSPDDFARASRIVEAYAHAAGVQARGAVMFGDEMIDEASHKMARAIVARGRAAGLGHDDPPGSHRHDDPRP